MSKSERTSGIIAVVRLKVPKALIILISIIICILPVQGEHISTHARLFDEYSIKAIFTVNFARLTRWPSVPSDEVMICVMGNNTMQSAFRTVENQIINGHPTQLRVISRDKEIAQCQVLFISDLSLNKMRKLYSSARNHPILTISEVENITGSGAIINFIKDGDKIRFQVNVKNAQQAGLKISSRLLKLAIVSEQ